MSDRNRLKHCLAAGETGVIAGNCADTDVVDLLGSLEVFDAVWIDMEHGPTTWPDLADLSRAADLWGLTSIVRVASHDPAAIGRTLGEGIDGVIVPHVNTRAEAEQIVDAALFAPLGHRGASGGRRSYGTPSYHATANDETFVAVMIEDVAALDALPAMLEVPGIDVFFVARYDLAQSMDLLHTPTDPRVVEAYDHAITTIVAAGRTAGGVVAEADLPKYQALGVRCIKAPMWQRWVATGAATYTERINGTPTAL